MKLVRLLVLVGVLVTFSQVSAQTGCCVGTVGDVNGDDALSIGDISALIDGVFITGGCENIGCLAEADINQSGGCSPTCEDITIGDITAIVECVFILECELWGGMPECLICP